MCPLLALAQTHLLTCCDLSCEPTAAGDTLQVAVLFATHATRRQQSRKLGTFSCTSPCMLTMWLSTCCWLFVLLLPQA
jgi:hypothetical protein